MPLAESLMVDLRRIAGEENVLTAKVALVTYSFDGTAAMQQMPGCVVFAQSTREVAEILKLRLGGTITGEHGVGLAKKSFLPKFAGEAQLRVMRELRRALDPNGILNPGKMFD